MSSGEVVERKPSVKEYVLLSIVVLLSVILGYNYGDLAAQNEDKRAVACIVQQSHDVPCDVLGIGVFKEEEVGVVLMTVLAKKCNTSFDFAFRLRSLLYERFQKCHEKK